MKSLNLRFAMKSAMYDNILNSDHSALYHNVATKTTNEIRDPISIRISVNISWPIQQTIREMGYVIA